MPRHAAPSGTHSRTCIRHDLLLPKLILTRQASGSKRRRLPHQPPVRTSNATNGHIPPGLSACWDGIRAAKRHSCLDLTVNVYTDPTLLDVAGAMAVLPGLGLSPVGRPAEDVRA